MEVALTTTETEYQVVELVNANVIPNLPTSTSGQVLLMMLDYHLQWYSTG